jgi:hypothetical protein
VSVCGGNRKDVWDVSAYRNRWDLIDLALQVADK